MGIREPSAQIRSLSKVQHESEVSEESPHHYERLLHQLRQRRGDTGMQVLQRDVRVNLQHSEACREQFQQFFRWRQQQLRIELGRWKLEWWRSEFELVTQVQSSEFRVQGSGTVYLSI